MTKDIVWHESLVDRQDRNRRNKHKSGVVWFTGCPASGKSTIAHHMAKEFFDRGVNCYVLDGDNVRHGINSDLGFSREDRRQNLRRIAEISKLFVDAGMVVLAAFVSPFREDRDTVREIVGSEFFFEVYVKCSIETCEKRDPKGLYKKARSGALKNFTGTMPMPGDGGYEWAGWVPVPDLPHQFNPQRGFAVTANQRDEEQDRPQDKGRDTQAFFETPTPARSRSPTLPARGREKKSASVEVTPAHKDTVAIQSPLLSIPEAVAYLKLGQSTIYAIMEETFDIVRLNRRIFMVFCRLRDGIMGNAALQ